MSQPVSRRSAMLRSLAAAAATLLPVEGAQSPAHAAWWLRTKPGKAYQFKTAYTKFPYPGIPVDDYDIGPAPDKALAPRAYAVHISKPIFDICPSGANSGFTIIGSRTADVGTGYGAGVQAVPIDRTKYTGTFPANSIVTVVDQAGYAAQSATPNYVNGLTVAYDTSNPLVGTLYIRLNQLSNDGFGGNTAANKIGAGNSTTTANGYNAKISRAHLTVHLPQIMTLGSNTLSAGISHTAYTAPATILSWDFRNIAVPYVTSGITNTMPGRLRFQDCLFDQSSLATGSVAGAVAGIQGQFFNLTQPYEFVNCNIDWDWTRWAQYATVTAVTNPDPTNPALSVVTIDRLPTKPDAFLRRNLIGSVLDPSGDSLDVRWRVHNMKNAGALNPTNVSKFTANGDGTYSLQLTDFVVDGDTSKAMRGVAGVVNIGDPLAFWPETNVTAMFTGQFAGMTDCFVTYLGDCFGFSTKVRSDLIPSVLIKGCVFYAVGANKAHADLIQGIYGDIGTILELCNCVVVFGYKPGSVESSTDATKNFAKAFRWGNPREIHINSAATPYMHDFLFHDNIVIGAWDFKTGCIWKRGTQGRVAIIAVRANSAGTARVSFPGGSVVGGNSAMFGVGDKIVVGGSPGSAWDGVKELTSAGASLPQFTNYCASFKVSSTASAGTNTLQVTAAVLTSLAAVGGKNAALGLSLYRDTDLTVPIGAIQNVDTTASTITLDQNIPAADGDVTTTTTLYVAAWFDIKDPFTSTGVTNHANAYATGAKAATALTLTKAKGTFAAGDAVMDTTFNVESEYGMNVGSNPTSTSAPLTKPLANGVSNKVVRFGTWFHSLSVGLNRLNNLYVRNLASAASIAGPYDQAVLQASCVPASVENVLDMDKGTLVPFVVQLVDGITGAASTAAGQTSVNPQLSAPLIASITNPSAGVAKINLVAANQNALGYMASVDGGAWQIVASDGTVSGLSAGSHSMQVRAMNLLNDLGVPVNPGAPTLSLPFNLAA